VSDDERDFILLCDSILDDGEVSADEAYGIAEWLNDHEEMARSWPATELIKPLQEVWADGSVNRRELHRLARLLVSIQRQWSARSQEIPPFSAKDRSLPEFTSPVVSEEPRLPSLNARIQVPSSTELGVRYDVDLSGPACNCPDWRGRRSRLPTGHLSRCCKHILDAYAQLSRAPEAEDWLLCFIDTGWPANPRTEWKLLTIDDDRILISTPANKGWANVFAKEDATYTRFGYNVEEERWAYGSEPEFALQIIAAIGSFDNGARHRRSDPSKSREQIRPRPLQSPRISRWYWLCVLFGLIGIIALIVSSNQDKLIPQVATTNVLSQRRVPAGMPWTTRTNREITVNGSGTQS